MSRTMLSRKPLLERKPNMTTNMTTPNPIEYDDNTTAMWDEIWGMTKRIEKIEEDLRDMKVCAPSNYDIKEFKENTHPTVDLLGQLIRQLANAVFQVVGYKESGFPLNKLVNKLDDVHIDLKQLYNTGNPGKETTDE